MKSFIGMQRLNEKVSKKEINAGLKDKNVQVGIEYEFLFDEDVITNEEEEDALKHYIKLKANVASNWMKALDARENYTNEILLSIANTKSNYLDKINKLKIQAKEYTSGPAHESIWEEINDNIDIFDELESVENYPEDVYEMDDYDAIEWEPKLPEEFSWDTGFSIYIEDKKYEDYFYWLKNYKGVSIDSETQDDLNNCIYDGTNVEDTFENLDLVEPDSSMSIEGKTAYQWEEIFHKVFIDDRYLPFDVGDAVYYHNDEARYDLSHWGVGSDSSLTGFTGVEITSPILSAGESVSTLQDMFKFVTKHGSTDASCGLHVNMSYKNRTFKNFDFLKVMVFMEEEAMYKLFRKSEIYAKSVTDAIHKNIKSMGLPLFDTKSSLEIFNYFKRNITLPEDKYFGINISEAMTSNRLEFRHVGGKNYTYKTDFVVAQIGRYSHYMRLGFDEAYKKKEYNSKLVRLYNEFYPHKQKENIGDVSEHTIQLILRRGEWKGRTNDNLDVYFYNRKAYYIDGPYNEVVMVKEPKKAKKDYPFLSKHYSFSDLVFKSNVIVAVNKYQKVSMKAYISKNNSNLYLRGEGTITALTPNEYKQRANKITLI